LGLSKIGAILVPLNWRLAGPELEFILQDSGSRMLIFEPEFEDVVSSIRPRLNFSIGNYLILGDPCPDWVIEYEKAIKKRPTHEPPGNGSFGDEDPHVIMYTSGTTGIPKGAVLSQRKTFFNVLNADIVYNLTSTDIVMVTRPMFHSGGLLSSLKPHLSCIKGGPSSSGNGSVQMKSSKRFKSIKSPSWNWPPPFINLFSTIMI
jgi:fatty-acyl-CoA synthase